MKLTITITEDGETRAQCIDLIARPDVGDHQAEQVFFDAAMTSAYLGLNREGGGYRRAVKVEFLTDARELIFAITSMHHCHQTPHAIAHELRGRMLGKLPPGFIVIGDDTQG